jgi:hypothetical protein
MMESHQQRYAVGFYLQCGRLAKKHNWLLPGQIYR